MNYQIKTLPSGIVIENVPNDDQKYRWYIKGTHLLHNEGKPAIEYANGAKYYCVGNVSYNEKDYWNHPNVLAFKYLKEHPELEAFA